MKKFTYLLIGFIILSQIMHSKELIVVVGDKNYPPYYYFEDNKYSGFSIEIAQIVAKKLKYELKLHRVPFARAIEELKNGSSDMITNFFMSPQREKIVYFTTESHIYEKLHFFTLKNEQIPFSGIVKDMRDYDIGIVSGYSNGSYIDTHPKEFKLISVTGEPQQIMMLLNNRYKLAIGTKEVIIFQANKLNLLDKIKFIEPPISNDLVYMGFSKKIPGAIQISEDFSREITSLKKTETYTNLLIKYGFNTPE